jgi:signal transduction histidine kinase
VITWSLISLQLISAYLYIFTDTIIYGVYPINAAHPWAWHFGVLSILFELSFFGFFLAGVLILYRKIRTNSEPDIKTNLKYMLWTIVIVASPASVTCIILPRFGYFNLNWLGPITEVVWIPVIAYSIIRYRQMNVRAVVTEVLAIAMTAIFFINIFINSPLGIWQDIATFVVFLVLAIYLIRGVLEQARQKEDLADLNLHLEQKVAVQTTEIRHAYEVEKKARADLEKLNDSKNQFIMITQHHLRTPVASIIWELESILAGAHGAIAPQLREAVSGALAATGRLTRIVDDFLNISALKAGTNILTLSRQSLKPAIDDILDELKNEIVRHHITVTSSKADADWPNLEIDAHKMHDILLIVIENAVKYNRDHGTIAISTKTAGGRFRLTVENTGIGITSEELSKIGSALFYRGMDARKLNAVGMGVGLSVTKAIIRAHHGTFEIKSDGKNKGAKVRIGLPL